MKLHFEFPRDGAPVACDCEIRRNHDAEALTYTEAHAAMGALIAEFERNLSYVAPELYHDKFLQLSSRCSSILSRLG